MKKIFTLFSAALLVAAANAQNTVNPVDLGLSVQWGDRFLGSTDVNTVGDYYAFGENETKSDYTSATYAYKGADFVYEDTTLGGVYFKTATPAVKDVATEKLGKGWRMPTKEEAEEFTENCTITIDKSGDETTKTQGIFKISSKKNTNSITLCATGYYEGTGYGKNSYPYTEVAFYLSTLDQSSFLDYYEAVYTQIRMLSTKLGATTYSSIDPYRGLCVLPVYDPKESAIESVTADAEVQSAAHKTFRNGKLVIEKDGKMYNVSGAQLK